MFGALETRARCSPPSKSSGAGDQSPPPPAEQEAMSRPGFTDNTGTIYAAGGKTNGLSVDMPDSLARGPRREAWEH